MYVHYTSNHKSAMRVPVRYVAILDIRTYTGDVIEGSKKD